MIVDDTGMKPAPSKFDIISNISLPTNEEHNFARFGGSWKICECRE